MLRVNRMWYKKLEIQTTEIKCKWYLNIIF